MGFLALLILLSSCDEMEVQNQSQMPEINEELNANFLRLGFDPSDIEVVRTRDQDNPMQSSWNYLLEQDMVITQEALEEMLMAAAAEEAGRTDQYRTTNLVSSPRTIRIVGITCYVVNGFENLDSQMQQALTMAVQNFNNLNMGLNFTLSFSCASLFNLSQIAAANDIVVYKVGGPAGGKAGFPTGGDPYKWVEINSGTTAFGLDVLEHVTTHEIGHCLGLRHSDWFNRSLSCNVGGSEGQAGVGAIHIPGTPTGFDANSVMNACFDGTENGEFSGNDIIALETIY